MTKKLYFLDPSETLEDLKEFYFPPYITLAHLFHAPANWSLKPRVLRQYQLQYVVEGEADYIIEGIPYATRKGDLLFHGPGETHYVITKPGKPYVCISIVFHFGNTDYPLHELLAVPPTASPVQKTHDMGNFAEHPLEIGLTELVHLYRQPGLIAKQRCQHLLMETLTNLARLRRPDDATNGAKDSSGTAKLIQIRNYIDARLQQGFRHDELEKLTGWSRNYIISQFKRAFGMSPLQYLVWIRLEKAKELALQSGLSFSEIASEVGYSDIHAFGKIFKRKTGMSLSQFVATLFRDTPDR
ncbi:helix-turn-helix domain-containing protein [Paenibacillaceae bacterium WGS1546]|uniref:helix-turn-helix domain-containing protein n=1 Tax=Cohnella sp. WGS1546 TaxID=3366810 RepID=UPI00372D6513